MAPKLSSTFAFGSNVGTEDRFADPQPLWPGLPERLGTPQIRFLAKLPAGSTSFRRNPSVEGPFPANIQTAPASDFGLAISPQRGQTPPPQTPKVSFSVRFRPIFLVYPVASLAVGVYSLCSRGPPEARRAHTPLGDHPIEMERYR